MGGGLKHLLWWWVKGGICDYGIHIQSLGYPLPNVPTGVIVLFDLLSSDLLCHIYNLMSMVNRYNRCTCRRTISVVRHWYCGTGITGTTVVH